MRPNGSGSIRKKQYHSGKIYWEGRVFIGYDPGTGKRIVKSIYGPTQREVQRRMHDIIAAVNANTYHEPTKITVREWFAEYLELYCKGHLKPYTFDTYERIIRNHILPNMGALKLRDVTGRDVQRMINALSAAGKSPKTIKNIVAVAGKAFRTAYQQNMIDMNPCDRVELPKGVRREIHPLDRSELQPFLDAIEPDEFRNAFALCLFGGLREGECLGLTWDMVNLETGEISITQQLQYSKEDGWHLVPYTKSNKSRTIYLPPIALLYLQAEQERQKRRERDNALFWYNQYDLVFTNEIGEPVSVHTFYKHFKRIADSLGRPDLRPHDLRHTAATIAIASGADIKSVQSLMGHSSAAFTLNVYAHSSKLMMQHAADKMQSFYESL